LFHFLPLSLLSRCAIPISLALPAKARHLKGVNNGGEKKKWKKEKEKRKKSPGKYFLENGLKRHSNDFTANRLQNSSWPGVGLTLNQNRIKPR